MIGSGKLTQQIAGYLAHTRYEALDDDAVRATKDHLLFAAQPQLLAPLLQVIHRVIAGFLVKRAGFKLSRADTGVVTLIQRSARRPI